MRRNRFAFIWVWLLMPCALFAQSLDVYPAPASIAPSPYFSMRVRIGQQPWQPVFTHHSINSIDSLGGLSIGIFSFTGPVELEITPSDPIGSLDNVEVRPKPYEIKSRLLDGKIFLRLTKPANFVVEVNRSGGASGARQALLMSACPTERNVPKATDKAVVYFGPGVHQIGDAYRLASNTTYYLAGGAYLKGAMRGFGTVENVRICGRGILDSGHQPYQHPLKGLRSNILFEDGRNVTIEGITAMQAGNYQVKYQTKAPNDHFEVDNLKLIGWYQNTDGIHISDMDWKDHPTVGNAPGLRVSVTNSFINANDDTLLICDGIRQFDAKNCVIWDRGNGATFCLSWGGHQPVDEALIQDCYVIHKEGKNPVFLANHAGEADVKGVTFKNIYIEGDVQTLIGLQTMDHRYDPDPGKGNVHTINFQHIVLEGKCTDNFILGYNPQSRVYDIHLKQIIVDGKRIKKLDQLPLRTNEYTGPVTIR